jgi:hypothetical protein
MYLRSRTWIENGPRCARGTVALPVPIVASPARGLGMSIADWCAADPTAQSFASELFNLPVTMLACPFVSSNTGSTQYGAPPSPGAPKITLVSGAAGASQPGAVLAGNDSSGNPVYAIPQSPGQNMADFKASVDTFMRQQGEATPPAAVDCTSWYSIFSPACNQWGDVALAGAAVLAAFLVLKAVAR